MKGWLKKRGHVVLNWKTRYFVLDRGYLTYYVDKSDLPPYGKEKKGQICLAGFRIIDDNDPKSEQRIHLKIDQSLDVTKVRSVIHFIHLVYRFNY